MAQEQLQEEEDEEFDEEEEEVVSVEEIEARFKKLREELALQLQTNEQSVDEEMNK